MEKKGILIKLTERKEEFVDSSKVIIEYI